MQRKKKLSISSKEKAGIVKMKIYNRRSKDQHPQGQENKVAAAGQAQVMLLLLLIPLYEHRNNMSSSKAKMNGCMLIMENWKDVQILSLCKNQ